MSIYNIADLNINIENKYHYTDILCKNYIVHKDNNYDFSASARMKDILSDRKILPNANEGYLEALSIYRVISEKILDYDGFVFHSSVVQKGNDTFAFSARSGTGKTTHSLLWLEVFGDARIINGDKPLIRIINDKVYAYGTPWCGKESYNTNCKATLNAVCFIERATKSSISKISKQEAVKRIMPQLLIPKNKDKIHKYFDLIEKFIELVPAYVLKCDISHEAVITAYNEMTKKQ